MNNTDLLDKWIAALRSGEYKQTQNVLCDGSAYCCLGVLEMVAQGEIDVNANGDYRGTPLPEFWYSIGTKPHNVFSTGIGMAELVMMNDTEGLCFAEIANRLEGK